MGKPLGPTHVFAAKDVVTCAHAILAALCKNCRQFTSDACKNCTCNHSLCENFKSTLLQTQKRPTWTQLSLLINYVFCTNLLDWKLSKCVKQCWHRLPLDVLCSVVINIHLINPKAKYSSRTYLITYLYPIYCECRRGVACVYELCTLNRYREVANINV